MNLSYTDEKIISPDGIECLVLDTNNIEFSDSCIGRKCAQTIVLKSNGNEKINTVNSLGLVETTYFVKEGDAIFYNSENDIYVPRNNDGTACSFDSIENLGYEITTELFRFGEYDAVKVRSIKKAYLLPEIIEIPTCIKDAFGKGNHQFLYKGATLKKDIETGKVTGIEKEAFDKTWEILSKENNYKK